MKLFIPGPTDVREDVLAAMSRPPISHRGEEAVSLFRTITERAQKIFGTSNAVVLSTSSATGLMEAGVRCGSTKRILSLVNGAFADRWNQMAALNGRAADRLEVPWGEAIDPAAVDAKLRTGLYDAVTVPHNETSTGVKNPIAEIGEVVKRYPDVAYMVDTVSSLGGMPVKVDAMGIDLCLASVQKCLALPPGFALASVSKKLIDRARKIADRGWYFDLARMADSAAKGQATITPSLPHLFAMERQFSILLEEGLEARWDRHRAMAAMTRAWAKERFALYAREAVASDTVTCIRNSRGVDVGAMIGEVKRRGYLLSNGYGDLKGQAFRIAHMGERRPAEVEELLGVLDDVLSKM
ncbi:MAG TPA: alanine--glyoxylate aminotransferase family protein [Verrucomicrobiae bacterium]|nr:alanine--glyoxylate aminotransferase family protein [Verrucomicrobiae bacterium]